jgi:hypothetical protein
VSIGISAVSAVVMCLGVTPALADAAATPTEPSVVRHVQSTPVENGRTTVTWDPPASDGGSPITSYTIVPVDSQGNEDTGHEADLDAPAQQVVITGLRDGETYHFDVVATSLYGSSYDSYIDPHTEQLIVNQEAEDELATRMDDLYAANDPLVVAGFAETLVDPEHNGITFYWTGEVPTSIRSKFAPSMAGMQVKFVSAPYSKSEMDPQFERFSDRVIKDSSLAKSFQLAMIGPNFQSGTIDLEYCVPHQTADAAGATMSPRQVETLVAKYAETIPAQAVAVAWPCVASASVAIAGSTRPQTTAPTTSAAPMKDAAGHALISLMAQMSGRPLP